MAKQNLAVKSVPRDAIAAPHEETQALPPTKKQEIAEKHLPAPSAETLPIACSRCGCTHFVGTAPRRHCRYCGRPAPKLG